jgi:hypothetical protein
MFKPKRLTFDELVECLRACERKYGYSTVEFYRRFKNGELGDDDDVMTWAGLCQLYLTFVRKEQSQQGPDDLAGDELLLREALAVLQQYGDKPEAWMDWDDFEAELDWAEAAGELPD